MSCLVGACVAKLHDYRNRRVRVRVKVCLWPPARKAHPMLHPRSLGSFRRRGACTCFQGLSWAWASAHRRLEIGGVPNTGECWEHGSLFRRCFLAPRQRCRKKGELSNAQCSAGYRGRYRQARHAAPVPLHWSWQIGSRGVAAGGTPFVATRFCNDAGCLA